MIRFVSGSSIVDPGTTASVTIQTQPGLNCSITVTYGSGPSLAEGLGPKTASDVGFVNWTWTVSPGTAQGTWPIDVRCASFTARAMLTVRVSGFPD